MTSRKEAGAFRGRSAASRDGDTAFQDGERVPLA